jgi:hypothetical protein
MRSIDCTWWARRSIGFVLAATVLTGCPRKIHHDDGERGPSARAGTTVSMRFRADEGLVRAAIQRGLLRDGFGLAEATPHRIEGRRGSEARLRLLGTLGTTDAALPVAVLVDTEGGPRETVVRATVSDDFGFGSRAGLRGRYGVVAGEILDRVRWDVQAAGGGPDVSTVAEPPPAESTQPPSVVDRLKRLDELHASGLLTDQEYREKRRAIIDEL